MQHHYRHVLHRVQDAVKGRVGCNCLRLFVIRPLVRAFAVSALLQQPYAIALLNLGATLAEMSIIKELIRQTIVT